MTKPTHQPFAIGLSSLLLAAASADGSSILATLSSQDKIIGQRQSSGADALGYYVDSLPPQVGVAGGGDNSCKPERGHRLHPADSQSGGKLFDG